MSEKSKRAIEILEKDRDANEKLLSEPYYPLKGTAAEYRNAYQLAITALKLQSEEERKLEKVREYCEIVKDRGEYNPFLSGRHDAAISILSILEEV